MFDHLSHITDSTNSGISIQLCVAVADLALISTAWVDPFGDLVNEFGSNGKRCNLVPLLEVLVAMPEELNSRQLRLGQMRRKHMELYCRSQVTNLIGLLHCIINDENLRKLHEVKVLRCLSSWFNLHCKEWSALPDSCLVNYMISIVTDPRNPAR